VLLTADDHGTAEIMRATGKAKTVIWRWHERFVQRCRPTLGPRFGIPNAAQISFLRQTTWWSATSPRRLRCRPPASCSVRLFISATNGPGIIMARLPTLTNLVPAPS
jgi:hypothetical protein